MFQKSYYKFLNQKGAVKKVPYRKVRSREKRLLIFVIKRDGCPLSEAAKWWYNVTAMKLHITGVHYTPIQLKMPLEIERIIEVNDPVYTFHEVMSHIDLHNLFLIPSNSSYVPPIRARP